MMTKNQFASDHYAICDETAHVETDECGAIEADVASLADDIQEIMG